MGFMFSRDRVSSGCRSIASGPQECGPWSLLVLFELMQLLQHAWPDPCFAAVIEWPCVLNQVP
jgi:hypothetical protein